MLSTMTDPRRVSRAEREPVERQRLKIAQTLAERLDDLRGGCDTQDPPDRSCPKSTSLFRPCPGR